MEPHEYAARDAVELAALVRAGETTAVELAQAALAGAARVDGELHAVVELYADALERAAEAPAGGPLAGVPTLRKDLGFTEAGRRAELGSRLAAGDVAQTTSLFWERLRAAGAVTLGRSATSELAVAITIEPPGGPATVTPWDPRFSAGGSSGGAAALVAAGVVPFAHANDAGGSIRIPAALCGVAGMKPSRGRVTTAPDGAHHVFGMVAELAVARSVRDLAAVLDAVAAPAPGDACAIRQPATTYSEALGTPNGKLRVALTTEGWLGAPVDEQAAQLVRTAGAALEALGHEVVPFALDLDVELYLRTVLDAFGAAAAGGLDALARTSGLDPAEHAHPVTLLWAEHGRSRGAEAAFAVPDAINAISRAVGAQLAPFDLLLTPTLAQPAIPLDTLGGAARFADAAEHNRRVEAATQFVTLFNFTGQPALSLPLGTTRDGLPLGVQAVAPLGFDERLVAVGAALEAALPWRRRIPPVHVSHPPHDP
ncbi:amidase [Conexibacter woesei]|uniref:Amidase n=1 Tax=Conexibacter woesei (strain DSM 14684 / CCUG 47730 / CIP 108061 / JCM 11494 / NBRC 100937 / ID131577) TaxID=469383 RepID=D3F8N7_CONWI|nr:amidase [Conexibacter woesei]ADB51001.1 Amidase [Conexibacter woesei DSM 14684]